MKTISSSIILILITISLTLAWTNDGCNLKSFSCNSNLKSLSDVFYYPIYNATDGHKIKKFNYISKKCDAALEEYKICFFKLNSFSFANLENQCSYINSDLCQRIKNMDIHTIPACQHDTESQLNQEINTMKLYFIGFNFFCGKDEQQEFCPIIQYFSKKKDEFLIYQKDNYQSIKDTCKSKQCTENFIAISDVIEEYIHTIEKINNVDIIEEFKKKEKELEDYRKQHYYHIKRYVFDDSKYNVTSYKNLGEFLKSEECSKFQKIEEQSSVASLFHSYNKIIFGLILELLFFLLV